METNNRSQREKILRNFISGSEFAAIRISSVVGDQNDIFLCTTATGNLQLIRLGIQKEDNGKPCCMMGMF